jgi:chemotaxis receptor (MCP) glutamine deamidase CheD
LNIGKEDNFLCVGSVKVDFIRAFLETEGIPLVSSALGGDVGRSIRFDTRDFTVYVKDIAPSRRTKIDTIELRHWLKSIGSHVAAEPKVDLW